MRTIGFTNKLKNDEKIQIFNYGNCKRDFGFKPSTDLRIGFRKFAGGIRNFTCRENIFNIVYEWIK